MQTSLVCAESYDEPDVTGAVCDALALPLEHLVARLERAHQVLRLRANLVLDQSTLQLAHCLADAHDTAKHLSRLIADVQGWTRGESRRLRPLDLRAVVRAAAAMAQRPDGSAADIALDAPAPAWVDGIDTRLVHVFSTLFAAALVESPAVVGQIRVSEGEVVAELRSDSTGLDAADRELPLGRAVVYHIVAAHGGHLELGPVDTAGVFARVTLPLARRTGVSTDE